jgi:coenzyme F420 hydrogenase subunit beta
MPQFSPKSLVVTKSWVDTRVPVEKLGADQSATGSKADAARPRHTNPCLLQRFVQNLSYDSCDRITIMPSDLHRTTASSDLEAFGIQDVVSSDTCIGCGACSVISDGKVSVDLNANGIYGANADHLLSLDSETAALVDKVCPFSNQSLNEDELGIPDPSSNQEIQKDIRVGAYTTLIAGRVLDSKYINGSSSGGLTSWLTTKLMENGLIKGVIHVGSASRDDTLFSYTISRTIEEIIRNRKSIYYPTTLTDALLEIKRSKTGPYAIVGVPCFIKAARLIANQDNEIGSQLRYYIGIVCGHMKTKFFAEANSWELGIDPGDIKSVDFRVKDPNGGANQYHFAAESKSSNLTSSKKASSFVSGNWGHAFFQPNACNYCDDVFAETADIVFGDAWIPRYKEDWRGANVVVARNNHLRNLFIEGSRNGEIEINDLSLNDVVQSQQGGLRHRREGLSVRIANDRVNGIKHPSKRIFNNPETITYSRRKLIEQRRVISRTSIEEFRKAKLVGSYEQFQERMKAETDLYTYMQARQYPQLTRHIFYDIALFGWHHQANLGGALTFFALHQLLKKNKFSVVVVWKPRAQQVTKAKEGNYLVAKKYYRYSKYRDFDKLHELRSYCSSFVLASDQLWQGKMGSPHPDYELLGCGDNSVNKISIATSFGGDSTRFPYDGGSRRIAEHLFGEMDHISVRESNGVDMLRQIGLDATQILDPVFLISIDTYHELALQSKISLSSEFALGYILDAEFELIRFTKDVLASHRKIKDHYFMTTMLHESLLQRQLQSWNKHGNANLIPYSNFADLVKAVMSCSVFVTTSYHGACLATIFQKPFICVPPKGRGNSRFALFDDIGLGDRILSLTEVSTDLFDTPINWRYVEDRLNALRLHSFTWLSSTFGRHVTMHP